MIVPNIFVCGPDTFGHPSIPLENALKYLESLDTIDIDIENEIETQVLLCIQLGNKTCQIVFTDYFEKLRNLLETKLLRIHNGLHDLRFLYRLDIYPENVRDTFLQEMILNAGKFELNASLRNASLKSCTLKYCKVTLDKSLQKTPKLTHEFITYAATDIIYLEDIDTRQRSLGESLDIMRVYDLENEYVKVLAYITNCGFGVNVPEFVEYNKKNMAEAQATHERLKELVIQDEKLAGFVSIKSELFSTPETVLDFNWSQTAKVTKVFEALGFQWFEKGKQKLDSKLMIRDENKHPLIKEYLKLSKLAKKISTFGESLLKAVGPDGRLRTNYIQIITTGRSSSRSYDEDSDIEGRNTQNIPKLSPERKFFIAQGDNSLVIADYAGQETRILANMAQDPKYTAYISDPEKDLHSYMCHRAWPHLRVYSEMEVKAKFPDDRTKAKPATFCIPYGGDGYTVARALDLPDEEGIRIFKEYMADFKGLDKFFDRVTKDALKRGFILVNKITRRKIFLDGFDMYKRLSATPNKSKEEWVLWKKYEGKKGRLARNYPVQGTGADMLKQAAINFFKLLKKNNLLNTVLINNVVHDEIVTECPPELIEKTKQALKVCMEHAGKQFCQSIPTIVDVRTSKRWKE